MEVVEKLKSKKSRGKKWIKRLLYFFLFIFILINFMAFMHARKFTHFTPNSDASAVSSSNMKPLQVAKTLLLGMEVPRPENTIQPNVPFEVISLENENGKISAWWMELDSAAANVIIAHGYKSCMSKMLPYAYAIRDMGYNVLLFDSTGSGDSEGNYCTIGHKESLDLKTVHDYLKKNKEGNVIVFGTSMGAALTLRAVAVEKIDPTALIIQCPFSTMKDATKGRFRNMGVPFFGTGHLLMFWGSVQNGFNIFNHNPSEYAKEVDIPTLHIWGEKDDRVTQAETEEIFENLAGEKKLVTLENAGHSGLVVSEPTKWKSSVRSFLDNH